MRRELPEPAPEPELLRRCRRPRHPTRHRAGALASTTDDASTAHAGLADTGSGGYTPTTAETEEPRDDEQRELVLLGARDALSAALAIPDEDAELRERRLNSAVRRARMYLQRARQNAETSTLAQRLADTHGGGGLYTGPDGGDGIHAAATGEEALLNQLFNQWQKTVTAQQIAQQKVVDALALVNEAQQGLAEAQLLPDTTDEEIKAKNKAIAFWNKQLLKGLIQLGKYLNLTADAALEAEVLENEILEIDPDFFDSSTSAVPPDVITASGGAGRVTFDWSDVPNADDYTLYWDTQSGIDIGSATEVQTGNTDHTLTGLAEGVTVFGVATATMGGEESSPTSEVSASTDSAGAAISLSPNNLSFSMGEGGANPASQTLTMSNTGGQPLSWFSLEFVSWLTVSPTSGDLAPGQSVQLTVAISGSSLAANTYNGNVSLVSSQAPNQTLGVSLDVIAAPPPPPDPQIGLSTSSLSFSKVQSGPDPASQNVTVTNVGGQTLDWSATDTASWLTADPASGSLGAGASQGFRVIVDAAGLGVGSYATTITVSDPDAGNSPEFVGVTLNVTAAPQAQIALNPTSLTFVADPGTDPSPVTLSLANSGDATLNWSASDNASWLTVAPGSGNLVAGQNTTLSVDVDISGLTAGTHAATITVADPSASNSPVSVTVSLDLAAPALLTLNTTTMTFDATTGDSTPLPRSLVIGNAGEADLDWSATDNTAWLSLSTGSGSVSAGASQSITILADPTGLAAGTHNGTVTVTDPDADNGTQSVSVTLNVIDPPPNPPAIGLSNDTLAFSKVESGSDPSSQSVTLTNTGEDDLSWSATDNAAWLSVTPASGSLASGQSQNLTVAVNGSGLTTGNYNAVISVSDPAASNSPQTIAVVLAVTDAPQAQIAVTRLNLSPSAAPTRTPRPSTSPTPVTLR